MFFVRTTVYTQVCDFIIYSIHLRILHACYHTGRGEGAGPQVHTCDGKTPCPTKGAAPGQVDWCICRH